MTAVSVLQVPNGCFFPLNRQRRVSISLRPGLEPLVPPMAAELVGAARTQRATESHGASLTDGRAHGQVLDISTSMDQRVLRRNKDM